MFRAQLTGWLRMQKLGIPCVSIGRPPAFVAKSDRAQQNRLSKRSVHHYGADGHVLKVQKMV
jgi:hypothetical protein